MRIQSVFRCLSFVFILSFCVSCVEGEYAQPVRLMVPQHDGNYRVSTHVTSGDILKRKHIIPKKEYSLLVVALRSDNVINMDQAKQFWVPSLKSQHDFKEVIYTSDFQRYLSEKGYKVPSDFMIMNGETIGKLARAIGDFLVLELTPGPENYRSTRAMQFTAYDARSNETLYNVTMSARHNADMYQELIYPLLNDFHAWVNGK